MSWDYLIDSYEFGTVFITDDPKDSQHALITGIRADHARLLIEAHNKALADERRATVERIRTAALHSRSEYGPVSLPQFLAILDAEAER